MQRRTFLRSLVAAGAAVSLGGNLTKALAAGVEGWPLDPLDLHDGGTLRIPPGFDARVVAKALQPVTGGTEPWHAFPDGAACFPRADGGWTLVSNSEVPLVPSSGFVGSSTGTSALLAAGGVSALDFGPNGELGGARRLLHGTYVNCAGGVTPWGSWLTCEEWDGGLVWEVWPDGSRPARALPAMGSFGHEAAAVVVDDAGQLSVYLTEDEKDGLLYRWDAPAGHADLAAAVDPTAGRLFALVVDGHDGPEAIHPADVPAPRSCRWVEITGARNPAAFDYQDDWLGRAPNGRDWYPEPPLRTTVAGTPLDGGEGCWHFDGHVYVAAKGDACVWDLDLSTDTLAVLVDGDAGGGAASGLEDADNVIVDPTGTMVLIAQDHHELEVHAVEIATGRVREVVKMSGAGHGRHPFDPFTPSPAETFERSEVTGLAFDPSGTRLYCSSQRYDGFGITYEISGNWAGVFEA